MTDKDEFIGVDDKEWNQFRELATKIYSKLHLERQRLQGRIEVIEARLKTSGEAVKTAEKVGIEKEIIAMEKKERAVSKVAKR